MINNLSFTGRETMLTQKVAKPLEQQVVKASTYIEEKIAPKIAETPKAALESIYTSPFASTNVEKAAAENAVNRNGLNFFA